MPPDYNFHIMAYSSIKTKTGVCKICADGKIVPLTTGLCHRHYWQGRAKVSKERTEKRKPADTPDHSDRDLEKWFEYVATIIRQDPRCWNCRNQIPPAFYRMSSAHIIPKRKDYGCPSVATHPLNFLVLGPQCCHPLYDRSWDDAEKMPVFKLAKQRFKLFADKIAPEEAKNVPDCFYN